MKSVMNMVAAGLVLAAWVAGAPHAPAASGSERADNALDPSPCAAFASPDGGSDTEASYGRFGVELLAGVSDEGEGNALVSPLSVATVLAMAAEGATDPARRIIWEMLHTREAAREGQDADPAADGADSIDGEPAGDPNEAAAGPEDSEPRSVAGTGPGADLLCRLAAVASAEREDAGIALQVANGAFPAQTLDLNPAFEAALREGYETHVERVDYFDPATVERINAWVARATADAIPHLLEHLPPNTALVLANAMHFRGEWAQPFDPARTAALPFHTGAGTTIEVATMQSDEVSALYREDATFQALALPYGQGEFALVVVLPRAGLASSDALRRLAADPSWLSGRGFRRMRGHLSLPRITLNSEGSLLRTLGELGLDAALKDPNAFARIATPPPQLSDVVHSTMLVLDEKGTEAAAATAAIFTKSIEARFQMQVDRPFALALRHLDSGAFLFAGWVADPTGQ